MGGSPHEKKVRALLKKLRGIEELKMGHAGGEALELSQVGKLQADVRARVSSFVPKDRCPRSLCPVLLSSLQEHRV